MFSIVSALFPQLPLKNEHFTTKLLLDAQQSVYTILETKLITDNSFWKFYD